MKIWDIRGRVGDRGADTSGCNSGNRIVLSADEQFQAQSNSGTKDVG